MKYNESIPTPYSCQGFEYTSCLGEIPDTPTSQLPGYASAVKGPTPRRPHFPPSLLCTLQSSHPLGYISLCSENLSPPEGTISAAIFTVADLSFNRVDEKTWAFPMPAPAHPGQTQKVLLPKPFFEYRYLSHRKVALKRTLDAEMQCSIQTVAGLTFLKEWKTGVHTWVFNKHFSLGLGERGIIKCQQLLLHGLGGSCSQLVC